jgi:hypothetical protein
MTDRVIEALETARAAYERATEALRIARAAAERDELTVRRINVVEDDGTLRIVIGNSAISATLPIRGRLVEHPRRAAMAGILFVNDEGTECGGLGFSGRRAEDGAVQWGTLTFDDYEQDEAIRFGWGREGAGSEQYVEFVDRPSWSLADLIEGTGEAEGTASSRMRLAREEDGSVRLVLRDGQGRDRLRLVVPADGEPVAEALDAAGTPRSLLD